MASGDVNFPGTVTAGGLSVPGYTTQSVAVSGSSPAAPATTISTSAVMVGLAIAFTPIVGGSGKVWVLVSGVSGTSSAASTVTASVRYGTGTAPANGAAVTGTGSGSGTKAMRAVAAAATPAVPFTFSDVLTGLTPGTTYWLDLTYQTASASAPAILGSLSVQTIDVQ